MSNSRPGTDERKAAQEFNRLVRQSSLAAEGAQMLQDRPETVRPASSPSIVPAELAGRISLARELPPGGEADLMVVTDEAGAELVLKLYRPGVVPNPDVWAVIQAVNSRHVARLVDWGDVGGRAFEVMEYVGTGTLSDLVSDSPGGLGPEAVTEVVRQVVEALNVLHGARVIHRDLKPTNILLRSRAPLEVALADFGLSRYQEARTVFSAAGHTLAYTAPETFAGHVSPARDWWSLGMIVRELATGVPPFDGLSTEVVMLTLTSRPVDCLQVTDARLRLLCRGLLIRDPAARWGAAEVSAWLDGESPEVREHPAEATRSPRNPLPGPRSGLDPFQQCPYRGLAAFEEQDAEFFYGREDTTRRLLSVVTGHLEQGGLMFVTGPSGVGKSSLLRAGLLPQIASGGLRPGSGNWPQILMTPGHAPADELAIRLAELLAAPAEQVRKMLEDRPGEAARLIARAVRTGAKGTPGERLVLIIDQFEEIFTLAPEDERAKVITALRRLAETGPERETPTALVILGLRADFYAECAGYPELVTALQSSTFLVPTMTSDEIRAAVTHPAARAGLIFEEGLADIIVADAGSARPGARPGAGVLPLLSQALLATWEYRTGSTLTVAGYMASGGVAHSIGETAERVYMSLGVEQQHAMRALLSRMTWSGADRQPVRRAIGRSELAALVAARHMAAALDAVTRARLVVVQEDSAEIVHEALLWAWPRLAQWLNEDSAQRLILQELRETASQWSAHRSDASYLYSGSRLNTALAAARNQSGRDAARQPILAAEEQAFLEVSSRAARRVTRRRRAALAVLTALVLCAVITAAYAAKAASAARAQRAIAVSEQVAAESQTVSNPDLAGQLALAAWAIAPTSQASSSVLNAYTRLNAAVLYAQTNPVTSLAFSRDGQLLATVEPHGTVQLWDTQTRRPVRTPLQAGPGVTLIAFSPDGRLLAAAGDGSTFRLWNLATGQMVGSTRSVDGPVSALAFSPDGATLAVATQKGPVLLLSIATGQVKATLPGSSGSTDVVFSPNGKTVAAVARTGAVALWDVSVSPVSAAREVFNGQADSIAFSPDGKTLAVGTRASTVVLLNDMAGIPSRHVFTAGSGSIQVAFSPDGKMLATAGTDGTVRLWNRTKLQQVGAPLTANGISEAVFSPDGKVLATVSTGGSPEVQLWSLSTTISAPELARDICAEVGHGLKPSQWAQYIPDVPYRQSCAIP